MRGGQARGHDPGPDRHVRAVRIRRRVVHGPRARGQLAPGVFAGLPERRGSEAVRRDDGGDVRDRRD